MKRLLVALLLCASSLVPAMARTPAVDPPRTGDAAPALLGVDHDGNEINLADYRGKVVIVTFWASWCGYCLKELPQLNALQSKVDPQWLRVIAVNVKDETRDYRAMTRQIRDWTLLLGRDRNGRIAESFGLTAYPDLWIIDPRGNVAAHHHGYGEDSLKGIIEDVRRLLIAEQQRTSDAPPAG